MKNIHKIKKELFITNDEEIKEGDWILCSISTAPTKALQDENYSIKNDWEKIILTTDQDLIKDGVQAIDDEFLEWFVKNPSCEEFEVQKFFGFAEDYLIIIKKKDMTAVEYMVEELSRQTSLYTKIEIIEQAKEMEKEQQDEFAIGFAEWCIKKRIDFFDSTEIGETYTIDGNVSKYKMSELLEIYKKEKGL